MIVVRDFTFAAWLTFKEVEYMIEGGKFKVRVPVKVFEELKLEFNKSDFKLLSRKVKEINRLVASANATHSCRTE